MSISKHNTVLAQTISTYIWDCPITAKHLALVSSDGVEWLFGAANVPQPEGGVIRGREKLVMVGGTPTHGHHPASVRRKNALHHRGL